MKSYIKIVGIASIAAFTLQGCRADLAKILDKKEPITAENTKKGKDLLEKAWKLQGLDKLKDHEVYSYKGQDTWKGMLGSMGKVWPNKNINLSMKYKVGSFDGQATFLDGKREGDVVGLQNWNYYEIENVQDTLFQKTDKRIEFGVSAFQYFTEMVDRLKGAPIVVYAGEDKARGIEYDKVICTWNKIDAHDDADQYVLWINKTTGMVEYVQYTIRDNYLKVPGYKMMYGGVQYGDFKTVNGIVIPHEQTVFVFDVKEKKKKFLHQLKITDFKFDDFDASELVIDETKGVGGDYK